MTAFCYDFEFLENGLTIKPISIGIVRVNPDDSVTEYYAVNRDAPWARIRKHNWLMDNVVPSLPRLPGTKWSTNLSVPPIDTTHPDVKRLDTIRYEVKDFLLSGDSPPDLWTWFGAYDHVTLMQFWGTMMQRPLGLPMFSMDLKQECERLGLNGDDIPKQSADSMHNALDDAHHNLKIARFLMPYNHPRLWPLR
jgi:hypothetical protein